MKYTLLLLPVFTIQIVMPIIIPISSNNNIISCNVYDAIKKYNNYIAFKYENTTWQVDTPYYIDYQIKIAKKIRTIPNITIIESNIICNWYKIA